MTTAVPSQQEWLARMVRAYAGASLLLTDPAGRVLLLKPTYRPTWLYPGGVIDPGENPAECAVRELREETGLEIAAAGLRLLVVEWRDPIPEQGHQAHPAVYFMFDGGTIAADSTIRLQADEVSEAGFFPVQQALPLLHAQAAHRLTQGLQARRDGTTAMLHTPGYLG
ncbi:NUDIX domain-containing protein [Kitasatospora sp. NPDC048365]|uniref:NUDIX domain-containing protein n=1 Tax=Kitasatospora sp. NPDC048365 TaxID=3364050 RepID=UPI003712888F